MRLFTGHISLLSATNSVKALKGQTDSKQFNSRYITNVYNTNQALSESGSSEKILNGSSACCSFLPATITTELANIRSLIDISKITY